MGFGGRIGGLVELSMGVEWGSLWLLWDWDWELGLHAGAGVCVI